MAAKKIASILKTRPFWAIPAEEDLSHSVPGSITHHIADFHGGLEKIEVEATYQNDAGTRVPSGVFQHFEIEDGGKGKTPPLTAEHLAQIVFARCFEYANKRRRMVTFIVWLFGSPPRGKGWRHKLQFRLDGTPAMDNEDDGCDDADDLPDEPVAAVPITTRPYRALPESTEGEMDLMPAPLAMKNETMEAMSNSPVMQEMAMVRVVQEAFTGALAEQRAGFSGSMAEHRALSQQVRIEQSHALRDMKSMFSGVLQAVSQQSAQMIEFAMTQMNAANERADRIEKACSERINQAEQRVLELSRIEGAEREAMLEINRRGWLAFQEGMQMKSDSIGTQQEYDRAFLGMQLQALQSGNRKSAAGGALKSLLPFAATGISAFLRARGDEKSAQVIDQLSKAAAKANYGGAPQGNGAPEEPVGAIAPIILCVRELFGSLRPDQVKQLKTIMPTTAWSLFEGAVKTDIEAACIACLSSLNGFLQSDPAASMQVFGALDETQQGQLMTIVQAIQGFTAQAAQVQTPAPPAAPEPSSRPFRPPFGTSAPTNGASPRKMPPRPGAPPA
jgi:hypothetical protein